MKRKLMILAAVLASLALPILLMGDTTYKPSGYRHGYWVGVVPTVSTVLVSGTVYAKGAVFSIASGESATVALYDRSNDCAGSPCALIHPVTLTGVSPDGLVFTADLQEVVSPGGIVVVATGAGSVHAHVHWVTAPTP